MLCLCYDLFGLSCSSLPSKFSPLELYLEKNVEIESVLPYKWSIISSVNEKSWNDSGDITCASSVHDVYFFFLLKIISACSGGNKS